MMRSRDLIRLGLALAVGSAVGCASGQKDAERAGDGGTDDRAQIEALEAELAAAEARVEALEAERRQAEPSDQLEAAPPFSPEGLTDQLRRFFRPAALPESFEPGPTAWQEAEVPSRFTRDEARGFASASALATAIAGEERSASLGIDLWEVTTRVLVADDQRSAQAAILSWGIKDDAVEGEDVRLELRQGERGWYVEAAERRTWCRRGVTDDQRCR
jgi:hypothetical protein